MSTKNLIPRADGEGGIGIDGTAWGSGVFNTGFFDGVGIGTTNPSANLEIKGGDEPFVIYDASNEKKLRTYTDSSGTVLALTEGGEDSIRLDGRNHSDANSFFIKGNVGIGINNPSASFHLKNTNPLTADGGQPEDKVGIHFSSYDSIANASIKHVREDKKDRLEFSCGINGFDFAQMSLNNDGNVGIGTTDPTAPLTISSQNSVNYPYMSFDNSYETSEDGTNLGALFFKGKQPDDSLETAAAIRARGAGDALIASNDCPGELVFQTNPGGTAGLKERMTISKDGYVGVGVEDPEYKLHVSGDLLANDINVVDSEGNPAPVLTTDKLGLATSAVLENSELDIQFKLLTDENRFVVGTSGNAEGTIASGWYRFNDFQVKGATDIGYYGINPVDTRIYSDESSFILFKTDTAGNRVAHLVGGEDEVSANNAIAIGIAVKVDSADSPEDIEFVHTDGESYSVINGNSDTLGTNGLPIRQGFQNPSLGSAAAPLLIDGGSF